MQQHCEQSGTPYFLKQLGAYAFRGEDRRKQIEAAERWLAEAGIWIMTSSMKIRIPHSNGLRATGSLAAGVLSEGVESARQTVNI